MTDSPKARAARKVGRIVGIVLLTTIVTAFTAVCSVEIIIQAWAAPDAPRPPAAPMR